MNEWENLIVQLKKRKKKKKQTNANKSLHVGFIYRLSFESNFVRLRGQLIARRMFSILYVYTIPWRVSKYLGQNHWKSIGSARADPWEALRARTARVNGASAEYFCSGDNTREPLTLHKSSTAYISTGFFASRASFIERWALIAIRQTAPRLADIAVVFCRPWEWFNCHGLQQYNPVRCRVISESCIRPHWSSDSRTICFFFFWTNERKEKQRNIKNVYSTTTKIKSDRWFLKSCVRPYWSECFSTDYLFM